MTLHHILWGMLAMGYATFLSNSARIACTSDICISDCLKLNCYILFIPVVRLLRENSDFLVRVQMHINPAVNGSVALVRRGSCYFTEKTNNLVAAGESDSKNCSVIHLIRNIDCLYRFLLYWHSMLTIQF